MDCQKVCVGAAEHKSSASSLARLSKIFQKPPASKKLSASKMTGTGFATQNNMGRRKITFISHCESTFHLEEISTEKFWQSYSIPYSSPRCTAPWWVSGQAPKSILKGILTLDYLIFQWSYRTQSTCNTWCEGTHYKGHPQEDCSGKTQAGIPVLRHQEENQKELGRALKKGSQLLESC